MLFLSLILACEEPVQETKTNTKENPPAKPNLTAVKEPFLTKSYELLGCGSSFRTQSPKTDLQCVQKGKGLAFVEVEIVIPPADQNHAIPKLYVMQSEVTQGFYQEITGKSPILDCEKNINKAEANPGQPVYCVTFADALQFANMLSTKDNLTPCYEISENPKMIEGLECTGYRLPTFVEWKLFAPLTQEKQMEKHAWYMVNSEEKTHLVTEKQSNIFGLYDVHGNVSEWVWKDEGETPFSNELVGEKRLSVGGSAGDMYSNLQLDAARLISSQQMDEGTGFRLIRVVR